MKTKTLSVCLALAAVMVAPTAMSATVLFQDNFNRGENNMVGQNWSEYGHDLNDVARVTTDSGNQALLLRDYTPSDFDAAATHAVSTLGYENLSLSFKWRPLTASEESDKLWISLSTKNSMNRKDWTDLASFSLGNNDNEWNLEQITSDDFQYLDKFGNLSNVYLRFWTDVGISSILPFDGNVSEEGAQVDDIVFSGDRIVTNQAVAPAAVAVPEPGQLALFGLGLFAMATARRGGKALRALRQP